MKVEHYVVGWVETNCYFAINEATSECIVIDPGDDAAMLASKIDEKGYTPAAILLTHGHFDHATGANELAERYHVKIYVHEDDFDLMADPQRNCCGMMGRRIVNRADEKLRDRQVLQLAGFDIQVIHTPGHTPGGVCFYFEKEGVLFAGDTLFCESVGRTDFPGGSSSTLFRSIRDRLFVLPDLTIVYTGHGEPTQIGSEKKYNPFV